MFELSPHIEMSIRLFFFIAVLMVMGIWERLAPKRQLLMPKKRRWLSNLLVVAIDTTVVRLVFPLAAVGVALYAHANHIGLWNNIHWPYWLVVTVSVIILDMVIYWQHVLFHHAPLLWRVHRMHHVDLDVDVTTGVRFHPIEILISLLIKFATILSFGMPALSVLIFEVLLNAITLFNHSNIRMPFLLDKAIRSLIVTPDMHRVHHSTIPLETNSNFGFNLSLWDRIFGTYRAQPRLGHDGMQLGISTIRETRYCINLLGMLWLPFSKVK